MLNNSTSVVTGSNFSFVCPRIFSCFTVFAIEIKDGAFRFRMGHSPRLNKFHSQHEVLPFSHI